MSCYLAYKQIAYEFVGVSPITFKQVAFANKRQVPVLQIDDNWKLESQEIGLWLEDQFPHKPLLGNSEEERREIIELDDWISHQLIPTMFKIVVDWPSINIGMKNGWKLSRAVNQATALPRWVRFLWPIFVSGFKPSDIALASS